MQKFTAGLGFALTTATTLSLSTLFSLGTAFPAMAGSFRSIDGSDNNLANPDWGATHEQLLRLSVPAYEDGISDPSGSDRPSARAISNAVSAQSESTTNSVGASDWLWQWGQFLDHDLSLTEGAKPDEPFNIAVPTGDPFFDPFSTGTQEIGLNRSIYDTGTGTDPSNPRQQVNEITAYIDASNVYGSDATRAAALRSGSGGKLLTSVGDNGEILMPFNTGGLSNAGGTGANLFLGGDVRANEQVGLTAVHTLFVREHNRLADSIKARLDASETALVDKLVASGLSEDDFIYESARKVVGAQMQIITYEEFLPLVLGTDLDPYSGYDDTVNAGIANEFSTAAYRFGHTMLSPEIQRFSNDGTDMGSISLLDNFFNPSLVTDEGIDSLLLGLASQTAQEVDTKLIDDVRNFLFGPPGAGGFDLASLNIQRGRDHGLAGINDVRESLGLTRYDSFLDLTGGDTELAAAFASVYDTVDDVDLWIGGLAEAQVNGGLLGETFNTIVADQFLRLRDGDRFFYQNDLEHLQLLDADIANTRLSDIIRRNSSITSIQDNAFIAKLPGDQKVPEPGMVLGLIAVAVLGGKLRRSP